MAPVQRRRSPGALFLARGERSASTVRTYLGARLAAFFAWAKAEGLVRASPADAVAKPGLPKRTVRFLSRDHVRAIIAAIEADTAPKDGRVKPGDVGRLADVVRVAVGTGMRLGEICHMRWSWVDFDAGFVTVRFGEGFRTKSGHDRPVPLVGSAHAVLTRLYEARADAADGYVFASRRGRPGDLPHLREDYVSGRFRAYARAAGLPDWAHFHSLRHAFASWLVQDGVDLYKVKELLGHSSIDVTMTYAHLAPDALVGPMQRAFDPGRDDAVGERMAAYGLPPAAHDPALVAGTLAGVLGAWPASAVV